MDYQSAHLRTARTRLGDLAGLQDKTKQAEQKILKAAHARIKVVQEDIAALEHRGVAALLDEDQARYLKLRDERGRLIVCIADAGKRSD